MFLLVFATGMLLQVLSVYFVQKFSVAAVRTATKKIEKYYEVTNRRIVSTDSEQIKVLY